MGAINVDAVLADVIYKSNPKQVITAFKTFDTVHAEHVSLTSELINGFFVRDYLTSDTPQTLYLDNLRGNVIFRNINVTGVFNGINATELDQNSIKLFGDQFTEAELIFNNTDYALDFDVHAEILEIVDGVNSVQLADFVTVDDYLEFNGNVYLNKAFIDDLTHINGEFLGNGILNGEPLDVLESKYLSVSKSQEIIGSFIIKTAIIKGDLDAILVNGYPVSNLIRHFEKIRNMPGFISTGDKTVRTIFINGNVTISKLNGHNLESIKENAIWLNRPNTLPGSFRFLEPVSITANIQVEKLNAVDFYEHSSGIVRKSELDQKLEFFETKEFINEIHVNERIDCYELGTVRADSILTKTSESLQFAGGLNILGNLKIRSLQLSGDFNGVPFSDISTSYAFDESKLTHILKMSSTFNVPVQIDTLVVHGTLNGIPDISANLQAVVRRDYCGELSGKKIFNSKTHFNEQLQMVSFNDINLNTFLEQVILNEQNGQALVLGNVVFAERVQARRVHIEADILAQDIMQCSILDWMTNSIRIDEPVEVSGNLRFKSGTFLANNIEVEKLNEIRLDEVITKHTAQNISGIQRFSIVNAYSTIDVGGLVNGFNLKMERDNTVMVS